MFCPRCGTENEADNRFCVSCGHGLDSGSEPDEPRQGLRERARGLAGRTRKERLITGGTVAAIVIAVVAFLTLDAPEEEADVPSASPEAEAACIEAKKEVAKAANQTAGQGVAGVESYSAQLITALFDFRVAARENLPPSDAATTLDLALRDTAIEAGAVARLEREGADPSEIQAQVEALGASTREIDAAIEGTGLERCAEVRIVAVVPEGG